MLKIFFFDLSQYHGADAGTHAVGVSRARAAVWSTLHLPLIGKVMEACRGMFPTVEYAFTTVPTYPSGQIGFIMRASGVCLGARRGVVELPPRRCSLDESRSALLRPKRAPVPSSSAPPAARRPAPPRRWL